jgi:hypothetical protein
MQVRFEKREMLKANEQKFGSYKWLITECHYNHRINYLLKVVINFCVTNSSAKFVEERYAQLDMPGIPNLF